MLIALMKSKKAGGRNLAIPCGVYRHYKGQDYLVLGVARHSETEEPFVVYVRLYAREGCPFWIRPYKDFIGLVAGPKGKKVKRFRFVGTEQAP